jgi:membrane protease YdiL (CAAX protease family)
MLAVLVIGGHLLDQRVVWPSVERRIATGEPNPRLPAYRMIVLGEWAAAVSFAIVWAIERHPWTAILGVVPTGWRLALAMLVVIAPAVLFVAQVRTIRAKLERGAVRPERLEQLRGGMGRVTLVAPHTRRELRAFYPVAVTAGICEEWCFRGAMTAVLAAWWGLPLAVVLTNVAFGFGHAYQGRAGIVKTGLVGFVMSGIVLATGSLVPAMILHAIIDLGGGATAQALLEARQEPATTLT